MMGVFSPSLTRPSTTCGTAFAAASLFTVTRTSSDPARASAAHCLMVPAMSAVSVLVIDCTTIGALLPTSTPPTLTVGVFLRVIMAMDVARFYHAKADDFGGINDETRPQRGSKSDVSSLR